MIPSCPGCTKCINYPTAWKFTQKLNLCCLAFSFSRRRCLSLLHSLFSPTQFSLESSLGPFCRYRKKLCFWSLGISLYLELFCSFSFFNVISTPLPAEAAVLCTGNQMISSAIWNKQARVIFFKDKIQARSICSLFKKIQLFIYSKLHEKNYVISY